MCHWPAYKTWPENSKRTENVSHEKIKENMRRQRAVTVFTHFDIKIAVQQDSGGPSLQKCIPVSVTIAKDCQQISHVCPKLPDFLKLYLILTLNPTLSQLYLDSCLRKKKILLQVKKLWFLPRYWLDASFYWSGNTSLSLHKTAGLKRFSTLSNSCLRLLLLPSGGDLLIYLFIFPQWLPFYLLIYSLSCCFLLLYFEISLARWELWGVGGGWQVLLLIVRNCSLFFDCD